MVLDLRTWLLFLESPQTYSRPFIDFTSYLDAVEMDWYTDAAKSRLRGFGGHHDRDWFWGIWPDKVMDKDPSIEYLELFAVTVGVLMWTHRHKNSRIVLFCDNESIVHMLNRQSSKCPNCMVLIRLITLQCMIDNVRLYAKHVRTFCNDRADALSRRYD